MKYFCAGLRVLVTCVVLGPASPAQTQADEVFQAPADFLAEVFDGETPPTGRMWVTKAMKPVIRTILGRDLGVLRLRYWARGARSAWILDELGKDQPITTGIVIDEGRIADVRVLIYRESRGWEVRYPAFTRQFIGAVLGEEWGLDRTINGITGATLSVRALTRLARVALFLDQQRIAQSAE